METNSDCRSEEGKVVGLIDSIISIGRILRPLIKDMGHNISICEALKDLRSDEDLLNIIGLDQPKVPLEKLKCMKCGKQNCTCPDYNK